MRHHDAIVIGTGQSGPALARLLVAAGQQVSVIERKFFGGTCVWSRAPTQPTWPAVPLERRAAELVWDEDHPELRGFEKHLHRQMDGPMKSCNDVHGDDFFTARIIGSANIRPSRSRRLALQAVALGNDGERRQRDHDRAAVGLGARDVGVLIGADDQYRLKPDAGS